MVVWDIFIATLGRVTLYSCRIFKSQTALFPIKFTQDIILVFLYTVFQEIYICTIYNIIAVIESF